MKAKNRKVVLNRSRNGRDEFCLSTISSGVCEELGLIDFFAEKAEGEAMDLNHGGSFSTTY